MLSFTRVVLIIVSYHRTMGKKGLDIRQGLMGHPCRSLEGSNAESNVDTGSPVQEVSYGNNIS